MNFDKTMSFEVERAENARTKEILKEVYEALVEKGYNPINQIVGYILSGDPTYITSHKDARNKIRTIERDELLEKMVKNYIGYWIIESGVPHDFDNVDTTVLEVIKDNIVSVLKTVVHQKTLESIVRKDLFSGLYSEEYLYGEGKKIIDQYTVSTICMFKIINIQQINKDYSRELGNKVITQISNYVDDNLSQEYVFVRYMGPKFVIAFSGVEANSVADFLNDIKEKIESMQIHLDESEIQTLNMEVNSKKKLGNELVKDVAVPKLNFVISSYYKGTGLEEVLKKLEEYLDNANPNESDITNI